jgi:hypothetical protein
VNLEQTPSVKPRRSLQPHAKNFDGGITSSRSVDESGVSFQRLVAPRCRGRILAFENYRFNDDEVFFGPANECTVSLDGRMASPKRMSSTR